MPSGVLTQTQAKTFERGRDVANSILPQLEYLERVAAGVPDILEKVQEIRARRDYLLQMCECCLSADEDTQSP